MKKVPTVSSGVCWNAGNLAFLRDSYCDVYNDHTPPHFHARYGNRRALFEIASLEVLRGSLPPRVRGFVTEWATMHSEELLEDWERARSGAPLLRIRPLE